MCVCLIKVSKIEELKKLEIVIEENIEAMDKLENWINRVEGELKYERFNFLEEELKTLKYLRFTLLFLDKQYLMAYRKLRR